MILSTHWLIIVKLKVPLHLRPTMFSFAFGSFEHGKGNRLPQAANCGLIWAAEQKTVRMIGAQKSATFFWETFLMLLFLKEQRLMTKKRKRSLIVRLGFISRANS